MKFILILWVCSFIQGNACRAPMEYPTTYDSWYECSRDAHVNRQSFYLRLAIKMLMIIK